GEYIHFATSDDFEAPSFYKRCVEHLELHRSADVVSTQWKAVDESGENTVLRGWQQPAYRKYIGYEEGSVQQMQARSTLFFTLLFGYPAGVCNGSLFRSRAF